MFKIFLGCVKENQNILETVKTKNKDKLPTKNYGSEWKGMGGERRRVIL